VGRPIGIALKGRWKESRQLQQSRHLQQHTSIRTTFGPQIPALSAPAVIELRVPEQVQKTIIKPMR
jgi:hypothetical protein